MAKKKKYDREPVNWITINGNRVPVFEDGSLGGFMTGKEQTVSSGKKVRVRAEALDKDGNPSFVNKKEFDNEEEARKWIDEQREKGTYEDYQAFDEDGNDIDISKKSEEGSFEAELEEYSDPEYKNVTKGVKTDKQLEEEKKETDKKKAVINKIKNDENMSSEGKDNLIKDINASKTSKDDAEIGERYVSDTYVQGQDYNIKGFNGRKTPIKAFYLNSIKNEPLGEDLGGEYHFKSHGDAHSFMGYDGYTYIITDSDLAGNLDGKVDIGNTRNKSIKIGDKEVGVKKSTLLHGDNISSRLRDVVDTKDRLKRLEKEKLTPQHSEALTRQVNAELKKITSLKKGGVTEAEEKELNAVRDELKKLKKRLDDQY